MLFPGFRSETLAVAGVDIHCRRGGQGPPLLLLHGYPQTHVMWHRVAPALAERFDVVCADLRGYGDSAKPPSSPDHAPYSKRAMAADMVGLMRALGHERFSVAGHDRGARVVHRLTLDHPAAVARACVMDIAPTLTMYETTDRSFATAYYHWFFLIQPDGLPEGLIGHDPKFWIRKKMGAWSAKGARFDPEAVAEYERCFSDPRTIHASCEDYRAAAGIDLDHDRADLGRKIACPLLALWGGRGFVGRRYDVLACWRERGPDVRGRALDCGHYLPEEAPEAVLAELVPFLTG